MEVETKIAGESARGFLEGTLTNASKASDDSAVE